MRWMRAALVALAAIAAWCVAMLVVEFANHEIEMRVVKAPWMTGVYALAFLVMPVVAAFSAIWALRRWLPWVPSLVFDTRRRPVSWSVLALSYLLTAWIGEPMVQSDLTDMVIDQFRAEQQIDNSGILPYHRVMQGNPSSRTFLNAAVLPGVIVVYHEYQATGLNGAGGYYVFLWYGTGARYITSYPRWVS